MTSEMTIRELSKKSGVTKSYIQLLEKKGSDANPTITIMQRIADAFEVDPSQLYHKIED